MVRSKKIKPRDNPDLKSCNRIDRDTFYKHIIEINRKYTYLSKYERKWVLRLVLHQIENNEIK